MKNRMLFILALFAAVLAVFVVHALDFPGSAPNFERLSGGGVLFDVKPSFSVDAIYQRLADYGPAGRDNYAFRNLSVDILLPLAIFPALFLLMLHALNKSTLGRIPKALLYSFSFLYLIFDFAENGTMLVLLSQFPERMPLLAGALPFLTLIKRIGLLLALVVPLVIFGVHMVRNRLLRR